MTIRHLLAPVHYFCTIAPYRTAYSTYMVVGGGGRGENAGTHGHICTVPLCTDLMYNKLLLLKIHLSKVCLKEGKMSSTRARPYCFRGIHSQMGP